MIFLILSLVLSEQEIKKYRLNLRQLLTNRPVRRLATSTTTFAVPYSLIEKSMESSPATSSYEHISEF